MILCVDDEPINLTILEELLQDNYELVMANSGESCLRQISLQTPDLILLDVNMPDMDGLETCTQLKDNPATADIPIIFVSALASQEELMAGYQAGGDDYITKPFSEEILQKKIEIVLASQQRKRDLESISDRAVEALRDNLSTTDELDMVVKFLHRCQGAHSLEELAASVFACLREFELDGSLLILDDSENRVWFSDDIDRPMERQILESLRGQDSVISFGTRIAVNSDHATILVRNLPSAEERINRIRAHLTIMIEGLDSKLYSIQSQMLLDERRELLSRALDATRENLGSIDEMYQQQRNKSEDLLAAMAVEMQKSLLKLELSAAQEAALMKILESTTLQMRSVYDEGLEVADQFQGIIEELSAAVDNRSKEGE